MKPLPKEEAEKRLRGKDWPKKRDALKRLPPDVDAKLAAPLILEQLGEGYGAAWIFGRHCQRIPPSVIRECLRLLPSHEKTPERIFLREAVDADLPDAALRKAWATALVALLDLGLTYAWGSKQRKAKLKALAQQPVVLRAVQAAVVASEDPPIDMLAVLAIDASDASIDALMPTYAKGDTDSRLELLAVHATKNAAMTALLESVTRRREKKEEASSASQFFTKLLGVDPPLKSVKFSISLNCEESRTGNVPLYQGSLTVDSQWDAWWAMHLTRVDAAMKMETTRFGMDDTHSSDELKLGFCSIEDFPGWVAKAEKKLKVTWNRGALVMGPIRGKKREQLVGWMFSRTK
ncbi:MAG: hypothetical protein JNM17_31450 [Archangium sp.]|nr:hypothetical protein [Archangium sp.]